MNIRHRFSLACLILALNQTPSTDEAYIIILILVIASGISFIIGKD